MIVPRGSGDIVRDLGELGIYRRIRWGQNRRMVEGWGYTVADGTFAYAFVLKSNNSFYYFCANNLNCFICYFYSRASPSSIFFIDW